MYCIVLSSKYIIVVSVVVVGVVAAASWVFSFVFPSVICIEDFLFFKMKFMCVPLVRVCVASLIVKSAGNDLRTLQHTQCLWKILFLFLVFLPMVVIADLVVVFVP